MPVLEFEQKIHRPLEEVFAFFCDETNLERITPPWLSFKVLGKNTPTIQTGTLIDYRLSLRGLPIRWQSKILEWEPHHKFVDIQTRGPYRLWHHTHLFEATPEGMLAKDRVQYEIPLGMLGRIFAGSFVRRDIEAIFAYRRRVISEIFADVK